MPSPLRSRDQFAAAAALLGLGAGVLTFAYAESWGWLVALVLFPALVVRACWPAMPGWLLLTWVAVPTIAGEAFRVTQTSYLIVTAALAVVAAARRSRLDTVAIGVTMASPFFPLLFEASDWHRRIGAWLWFGGLLVGLAFGHVVRKQWMLIAELDRTRTRLAEAAVAEDRQRMARDLHDLVGHSFSVVLLHLSGARMILNSSPEAAAEALRDAEAVGRRGMDELRQALMLMHEGSPAPATSEAGDPEQVVAGYRDAGMRIDLVVTGALDGVSAAPRMVLCDVLRETLTNAAKHAPAPEAAVRIEVGLDEVALRVENALGAAPAGSGLGLTGLEHRVGAIDGVFRAGPQAGHWIVEVSLPRRLAAVTS
ncbi:sensor histidine kinase [Paractinoplanes abujensis]|uniref:histidine kinase n=1 Tax=Paractinoplanes abujensis TaxID=882441 RepID=A0A7W7CR51_9ACTN|nr:histidine kinase [Actinoplanes abujensis]MBB4693195.1 signal transduction histidine kinase [Actinoplanes abujensis]